MNVLSIRQPYASLIILGYKTLEERYFAPGFTGKLLIHAARSFTAREQEIFNEQPMHSLLTEHFASLLRMPMGKIIGAVDVVGSSPSYRYYDPSGQFVECENEVNLRCCYWNPDSFLWSLKNPHPWSSPLTISGKPGLWEIDDRIYLQLQERNHRQPSKAI